MFNDMPVHASQIIDVLERHSFRYRDEKQLQHLLQVALQRGGIETVREVDLPERAGRIDLVADRVGIEVKIDGSTNAVRRQLERYGRCGSFDELILVTSKLRHQMPPQAGGVPLFVVCIELGRWA